MPPSPTQAIAAQGVSGKAAKAGRRRTGKALQSPDRQRQVSPRIQVVEVPLRLDAIDRQIVSRLMADGRASAAAISRTLPGVSERAVRYRIERLIAGGVITVGAVVDPQALGLRVVADVFIEVAPGEVRDVARRLVASEAVSYVAASIGQGDLSIQVCAHDTDELARLVSEVVGSIAGVMATRTVMVPWKLKDVHQWQIPAAAVDDADGRVRGDAS
jgi:Lrp/AsnC family transcriptional regulator, regulator for asnA, asnC and gidA